MMYKHKIASSIFVKWHLETHKLNSYKKGIPSINQL